MSMAWNKLPTVGDAVVCLIRGGLSEENAKAKVNKKLNWVANVQDSLGYMWVPRNGTCWNDVDFFANGSIEIGKFGPDKGTTKVLSKVSGVPRRELTTEEANHFRNLLWSVLLCNHQQGIVKLLKLAGDYIKNLEIESNYYPEPEPAPLIDAKLFYAPMTDSISGNITGYELKGASMHNYDIVGASLDFMPKDAKGGYLEGSESFDMTWEGSLKPIYGVSIGGIKVTWDDTKDGNADE